MTFKEKTVGAFSHKIKSLQCEMRVLILAAIVNILLSGASAKVCIGGNKDCTPGGTDCNTAAGETCMMLPIGSAGKLHPRCGVPQGLDCACDNTLTSTEACEPGLSCQIDKKKLLCKPELPVGPACVSTTRNWELVYSHDANGAALAGTNINDLLNAIKDGAEVKVLSNAVAFIDLLNIQKVSVSFDQDLQVESAHGQNLYWVQVGLSGYELFSVMSSTGNAHYTQFFINDPENKGRVNANIGRAMQWFVRRCSGRADTTDQLSRLVQDGANVRVAVNNSVRHLEVADLPTSGQVKGISVEMRDKLNGLQFNTTEQWLYMYWSTDGTVLKSNWLVNTPQGTESELLTGQNIAWYVDTCWKFVYRNNGQGQALSGSSAALLNDINAGKRVKVKIGTRYYEVNVLRVNSQGRVTAQVFDSWDDNIVNARWKWIEASTSGSVKTVTLQVGGSTIISDVTDPTEVAWFTESRDWVTTGESNVPAAVSQGVDFRFQVALNGDSVWYQADSVNSFIGLMNVREFVYYNNQYYRRYCYANYPKRFTQAAFVYMDYRLGNMTQADYQTVTTTVNYFISQ